ncbi:V-type ATP synthase subunit D [Shimia thalassica]|jgi:V/A-type H+-transporting ATPase subunit D|uniref:V-type ATP synthase subunit D n=1 Tax=Shimia thalassica TaxID=1715693 RepID=UPI001C09EBEC|nr:V-type ATP synthase subunit D [Shimia thalassica]MBU2942567.1 V-type ATP synthase subunit D [Shimia thalassica]MDO6481069.1 V-type ATP synthase subunit D [Shimia thalassica]MDO6504498.1 V-type ATP synthase subunit D [Shimia thalassica]MDO6523690.1 V-type ATP synthase subunit D [Shimia thalassica]MDO6800086.1 V-type ATP synthase subunit D [Shimia thalassica]
MARLQLNKSSLARQVTQLQSYKRFLPSLDLKRQQLMAERARARTEAKALRTEVDELVQQVGERLPMLAQEGIDLEGLVELDTYDLTEVNVVGVKVPQLAGVHVTVRPYSPMAKPHWVDNLARLLKDVIEARLRVSVAEERVRLFEKAVDTITQRVNLFEKVLIPQTQANIKRIRIYLNDEQIQAVVRSKLSKRKRTVA